MQIILPEIPLSVNAVDQLEQETGTSPDPNTRALLVATLADRAFWTGSHEYLDRLCFHLEKLPKDDQYYGRAVLAGYNREFGNATDFFLAYLRILLNAQHVAPDASFAWRLYLRYLPVKSFADPDMADFLEAIADTFSKSGATLLSVCMNVAKDLSCADLISKRGTG